MSLSIVVCTYNRSSFLKKCLNSILKQTNNIQDEKIEIIVIDNNSTDNTQDVIQEIRNSNSTIIHYFQEAQQGISYARTAGVKESNGKFIAFVDDDATVNSLWLDSLLYGIKNINAEVFGGPIYPNFEIECPKWIEKDYFVRKFRTGNGFLNRIKSQTGFPGGNMCVKKVLFNKIGYFDGDLGMKGKGLGLGEEPDFFYRLYHSKHRTRLYNLDEMSITHFEAEYKLTEKYLKERISLSGTQFTQRTINGKNYLGYIVVLGKLFKQSIDFLINSIINKKFRCLKNKWIIRGLIKGIMIQ